jgi:hypothetical protein
MKVAALRVVVRTRMIKRNVKALQCVVDDTEFLLAVRVLRPYDPELTPLAKVRQHVRDAICVKGFRHKLMSTEHALPEPSSAGCDTVAGG